MDINVTLFGEMLTFAVLLWVVAKYLWPQLTAAIEARQQEIEQGLKAAEEGALRLADADQQVQQRLATAQCDAAKIMQQAEQEAQLILAREKQAFAATQAQLVAQTESRLKLAKQSVQQELRAETVELVMNATERLLQQQLTDPEKQRQLIDKIITEI